jgi:hypothetical protein
MEREGVAVIANEMPQALANINLKESEERFGPYLIMCLYTFSLLNLMKKPASVTGIKTGWITHSHCLHIPDDPYLKKEPYFPAIRIKRGWRIPLAFRSGCRYLDNGDFMGYIGIGFDNHEQLAQDSLKQSEIQFRMMAEYAAKI